jgi:hypothetical protein
MAGAAFSKKKTLYTSKLDLNFRNKVVKCYIWSIILYVAEIWIIRKIDQKYSENLKLWCWRRTEISWNDHVRKEVLKNLRIREISYK